MDSSYVLSDIFDAQEREIRVSYFDKNYANRFVILRDYRLALLENQAIAGVTSDRFVMITTPTANDTILAHRLDIDEWR